MNNCNNCIHCPVCEWKNYNHDKTNCKYYLTTSAYELAYLRELERLKNLNDITLIKQSGGDQE